MSAPSQPSWLVDEPFVDNERGVLRTGKEAQIDIIERVGADGRSCLLARKYYLPRNVSQKGQLEAMGMQKASTFRNDVAYREGRQFRKSRDRRAIEQMSTYGKRLMQNRWTGHEFDVMTVLWNKGVTVPFPISYSDDRFILEYLGDADGAAPQLARARLDRSGLESALQQLCDGLATIVAAGWAHGDLSAYNLLWWDEKLWFIDFPQAVDLAANPQGIDYLHRDVVNVCDWFQRRGLSVDAEEIFAEMLGFIAWPSTSF